MASAFQEAVSQVAVTSACHELVSQVAVASASHEAVSQVAVASACYEAGILESVGADTRLESPPHHRRAELKADLSSLLFLFFFGVF